MGIDPQLALAVSQVLGHKHLGQWSSDHSQEASTFSGWNYVAIQWLGRQAARAHAYVYQDGRSTAQAARKSHRTVYGAMWKSVVKDGSAELASEENRIARLVERPNPQSSGALFQWEFVQQLHLHGACLIFNRPTKRSAALARDGVNERETAARYIIPVAMTQPVYPGEYAECPNGGVRIMPYETGINWFVNRFVHQLTGKVIPIEWLSVVRYPHPVLRGDGMSPTDAAGWWIDSATMIDMGRWKQIKRGPKPYGIVSVEGEEVDERLLDQIERRISRKLRDGAADDDVVALGAKVSMNTNTTPVEMDYTGAFDQTAGAILAAQGVSKSAAGLNDSMTYGSVAASNMMSLTVVQSDLDLLAGDWTDLAQDEGEKVAVEYEVQSIDDPELIERQLGLDLQYGLRTGKEVRSMRGLPPFGDWRDDARVTAEGFKVDPDEPPKAPEPGQMPGQGPGAMGPGPGPATFADSPMPRSYSPVVAVDVDSVLLADRSHVETVKALVKAGCRVSALTSQPEGRARRLLKSLGLSMPINKADGRVDVYFDDPDTELGDIAERLPKSQAKAKLIETKRPEKLGCVMLEAPEPIAEYARTMQAGISPEGLVGDGLEQWPHVTLLYGLVGCSVEEVVTAVRRLGQVNAVFGPVDTFDSEEHSVLKIGLEGEGLHRFHEKLKALFPVQETHPVYKPHLTLAYCTAEEAGKHKGQCILTGRSVRFTKAVVSIGGKKVDVPLRQVEPESDGPVVKSLARARFVDPSSELVGTLVESVREMGEQVQTLLKSSKGNQPAVRSDVIAAGLCLVANDTGRALMLQRALDPKDPASGKWEFPGGHVEPGEEAFEAAKREWEEEVGRRLPDVEVKSSWRHGIYAGFVATIGSESEIPINTGGKRVLNPDDPDGDMIETVAWWDVDQLEGNQSVRDELLESVPQVLRAIQGVPVSRMNAKVYAGAVSANGNGHAKSAGTDEGVWRTTKDGKRIFIGGDGEARAGGPDGEVIDDNKKNDKKGEKERPEGREKEPNNRGIKPQKMSAVARRAKESKKITDRKVQQAADRAERKMAKRLGGESFKNSEPVDIVFADATGKEHGIEYKYMQDNSRQKIDMNKYAMVRKVIWEKQNKKPVHTVVEDKSGKLYYRRGVGSFRVSSMHEVTGGEAELMQLMSMRANQLPKSARRTDSALLEGSWRPTKDGRGYMNSKTKEIVRPKK